MKKLIQNLRKWSIASQLFLPFIVGAGLLYIIPEWTGWIIAAFIAITAIVYSVKYLRW